MSQAAKDEKNTECNGEAIWEDYLSSYYEKPQSTRTWSGYDVKEIYTPQDRQNEDYAKNIGDAGEYPFTRGIHHNMFRGGL